MGSIAPTLYFFVVNLNALTARFVRSADGVYSTDSLTARSEANAETRQVPFPFGVQRPQADQEQQAMRCAFKARREVRMLEILREFWIEFANCPQRPTAAGFSETGQVPLSWPLGRPISRLALAYSSSFQPTATNSTNALRAKARQSVP